MCFDWYSPHMDRPQFTTKVKMRLISEKKCADDHICIYSKRRHQQYIFNIRRIWWRRFPDLSRIPDVRRILFALINRDLSFRNGMRIRRGVKCGKQVSNVGSNDPPCVTPNPPWRSTCLASQRVKWKYTWANVYLSLCSFLCFAWLEPWWGLPPPPSSSSCFQSINKSIQNTQIRITLPYMCGVSIESKAFFHWVCVCHGIVCAYVWTKCASRPGVRLGNLTAAADRIRRQRRSMRSESKYTRFLRECCGTHTYYQILKGSWC